MRTILTFLQRVRSRSHVRFWPKSRPRRILASAAVAAALALSASVLAADPALAVDVSSTPLSIASGHTCKDISGGNNTAVLCADLAIYVSSNGQAHVTAEAEVVCGGGYWCTGADVNASVEEGASHPTPSLGDCGTLSAFCNESGRTYLFPFNGFNISPGGLCVNNAWATLFQQPSGSNTITSITESNGSNGFMYDLSGNLSTPHYNVCEDSDGTFTFTAVT